MTKQRHTFRLQFLIHLLMSRKRSFIWQRQPQAKHSRIKTFFLLRVILTYMECSSISLVIFTFVDTFDEIFSAKHCKFWGILDCYLLFMNFSSFPEQIRHKILVSWKLCFTISHCQKWSKNVNKCQIFWQYLINNKRAVFSNACLLVTSAITKCLHLGIWLQIVQYFSSWCSYY